WTLCIYTSLQESQHRTPARSGPIRQIYARPFLLVVGMGGNSSVRAQLLSHATFVANALAMSSETHARVVRDVDAAALAAKLGGPNLILCGGPARNSLTKEIYEREDTRAPLRFVANESGETTGYQVEGSDCVYSGPGMGALFLM